MAHADAIRWNARYCGSGETWNTAPRSILTTHRDLLGVPGLAIDMAMGLGANSAYLVKTGWRVIGVDIADVAIFQARAHCPQIQAVIADLEHFWLPTNHFDLVLNLYYLDRALWPLYKRTIKPGGLLIIETLLHDMQTAQPNLPTQYLLQPGELRAAFQNWEILYDQEGWVVSDHGNQKAVASLIARRL